MRVPASFRGGALVLALITVGCANEGDPGAATGPLASTDIATVTAPLNPAPATRDFVLEAQNSVRLQTSTVVNGADVGARGTGSGPFLSGGVAIDVGTGVKVQTTHNLIADSIRLGTSAATGDLQTNHLQAASGSTHGGVSPLVPLPALPPVTPANPGSANLTAAANATVSVAAGRYSTVSASSGAKLRLAAGTYDLTTLSLSSGARLEALGAVELHVAGRLTVASNAFIGAAPGVTLTAKGIRVEVSGLNGTTGDLAATPAAATVGSGAQIRALVLVPNGLLSLGSGTQLTGAFLAHDIDAGTTAQFAFEDGFITCTPTSCDDHNPCTVDTCNGAACTHASAAAGTSCADGNACNGAETCNGSGSCVAGAPIQCMARDQCHLGGTCDPGTGACSNPAKPDDTRCDDGNACTLTDVCRAGACTGTSAVTCLAQDQCHVAGVCDPSSGACSNPTATDGTACDDANGCSRGDACQAGACRAGSSCAPNAACSGSGAAATCACLPGFTGDGFTCLDIDECALGIATCSAHASCANLPGSYACACNAGYTGDGITCTTSVVANVDSSAGGSVSVTDPSSPLSGVGVTVPPQTNGASIAVSITEPASLPLPAPPEIVGPVTHVEAGGAVFSPPLELMLKYDKSRIPVSGLGDISVLRLDDPAEGWVEVKPIAVDPGAGTVTVRTDRLSDWAVFDPSDPSVPECEALACQSSTLVFTSAWECTYATQPDGTACDDQDGCSVGETCAAGVCSAGIRCNANATCSGTGAAATCQCNSGYTGDGHTCSAVPGADRRATAIASGMVHSCALLQNGRVACWGDSSFGLLGNNQDTGPETCSNGDPCSKTPFLVPDVIAATAIATGYWHACALIADGTVKCWGDNEVGQLGNGEYRTFSVGSWSGPVTVSGLTGVTAIAAGAYSTCALLANGTVKCWGDNYEGALGVGTTSGPEICAPGPGDTTPCSTTPVTVTGLSGVAAIASGDFHACAVLSSGGVTCWGDNRHGQLGASTGTSCNGDACSPSPVLVGGVSGAIAVAGGEYHTCAAIFDGTVRCWGDNSYGQLGTGNAASSPSAVSVPNVSGATAIDAGSVHTCAVVGGNTVKCWGMNFFGQLGVGNAGGPDTCSTSGSNVPCSRSAIDVIGLTGATAIATGERDSCALRTDGSVSCWGDSQFGELGDDTSTPTPVTSPQTIVAFPYTCTAANTPCGDNATCASDGQGGFTCACNAGTTRQGASCVPTDVCGSNNGRCATNAACATVAPFTRTCTCRANSTGDGLNCPCDSGYQLSPDGTACVSSDPCATNNGGCSANALCQATPAGTASCTCSPPFTGDGIHSCACPSGTVQQGSSCVSVNPCTATPNGGCDVNAQCSLTSPTTRTCRCNSPFIGNGLTCECPAGYEQASPGTCTSICQAEPNGGCSPLANCSIASGNGRTCTCRTPAVGDGFSCSCPSGYASNGTSCVLVNPCATNNGGCDAHASCKFFNAPNQYTCRCHGGFTGDGTTCTPISGGGLYAVRGTGSTLDFLQIDPTSGSGSVIGQIQGASIYNTVFLDYSGLSAFTTGSDGSGATLIQFNMSSSQSTRSLAQAPSLWQMAGVGYLDTGTIAASDQSDPVQALLLQGSTVSASVPMANLGNMSDQALAFDVGRNVLYAVGWDDPDPGAAPQTWLYAADLSAGVSSKRQTAQAYVLGAVDTSGNLIGSHQTDTGWVVESIDTATGVATTLGTFPVSYFDNLLAVDHVANKVYAHAQDSNGDYSFQTLDLTTGAVTSVPDATSDPAHLRLVRWTGSCSGSGCAARTPGPLDPCALGTAACSPFATCVSAGPDQSACTCNDGYEGDGYDCETP